MHKEEQVLDFGFSVRIACSMSNDAKSYATARTNSASKLPEFQ
jgi:hypothetical protein